MVREMDHCGLYGRLEWYSFLGRAAEPGEPDDVGSEGGEGGWEEGEGRAPAAERRPR